MKRIYNLQNTIISDHVSQYRDYPYAFGVVRVVLRVCRGGDDPGGVPQNTAAQGHRGSVVQAETAVLQKRVSTFVPFRPFHW